MKKTFNNLREELTHKKLAPMVDSFVDYASKELGIKSMPNVQMIQRGEDSRSFGGFSPADNKIMIVTKNRHPMDIFRTLAHEMVHCKQCEDGKIGKDIRKEGETGSPQENEANAEAGVLMRNYAQQFPELFNSSYVTEEMSINNNSENLFESALKALRWASKAHSGQFRRTGSPYITHPKEVARFVKQFKKSHNLDALISAAYLHDTVEDTDTTHEDLVKQFGGLIADMVKELTSDKEAVEALGKGEYIAQKMSKMSSWALVIKLADRLANVQDIDSQTPEFQKRYADQTKLALDRLKKDRYLSKTHNKIISAIEDKIKEYVTPEPAKSKSSYSKTTDNHSSQVKQLGLTYFGYGRYGRKIKGKNVVTHIMKDGRLMAKPVKLKENNLRQWFDPKHPKGGWKRVNSKGEAIGPCAREPGEPKPKCMSNEKRAELSKKERAAAVKDKRTHDPNPERKGAPINVSNFGKGKLTKEEIMKYLEEKNKPTNPELWSRAKSLAKSKFDVYPSAYANGWAAKWYKSKGGGWKTVSENNVFEARRKRKDKEPDQENLPMSKTADTGGMSKVGYPTRRMAEEQLDEISVSGLAKKVLGPVVSKRMVERRPISKDKAHELFKKYGTSYGKAYKETGLSPRNIQKAYAKHGLVSIDESVGIWTKRKKLIRHVENLGWSEDKARSKKHKIFTHPDYDYHLSIPHGNDIKYGTGKEIFHGALGKRPTSMVGEDLDTDFELFLENAGEWGTDDLTKTYVRDTPGQKFWKYDELNEEGQLKHHNTTTSNFDICPSAKKAFEKDLQNDSLPEDKIHDAIVAVDKYLGLEKQAIKNKSITKREFDSFMSAIKDAKDKIAEIGGVKHDYHKLHIDNMRKLINVNEDYAAPMWYGFGNSDGKSGLLPTATRNTPMSSSGFTGAGPSIPMAEEEPVEKKKKKKSIKQIKAENNLYFKTKEDGLPTNKGPDNFVPFTPAGVGSIKEAKSPAWTRKEGQSETGGLNRKGIEAYRRENPGSKLSMAVTTKPSKLKKGSKAAKRRKSFCARMTGMKKRLTSAKTARDPNSRINKSLRKWNC